MWASMKFLPKFDCFLNHAALAGQFLALPSFFFLVLSVTNPKPPRMMSLSANYRPFLRCFRHVPPQDSFFKLAN